MVIQFIFSFGFGAKLKKLVAIHANKIKLNSFFIRKWFNLVK
jgi:hypothetical protein